MFACICCRDNAMRGSPWGSMQLRLDAHRIWFVRGKGRGHEMMSKLIKRESKEGLMGPLTYSRRVNFLSMLALSLIFFFSLRLFSPSFWGLAVFLPSERKSTLQQMSANLRLQGYGWFFYFMLLSDGGIQKSKKHMHLIQETSVLPLFAHADLTYIYYLLLFFLISVFVFLLSTMMFRLRA
jgi:hypothetical protein